MREIKLSADVLVSALLNLEDERSVCLLDSCGVNHLGSHLLIAGFDAIKTLEINESDAEKTLEILDGQLSQKNLAAIFTVSYDFGLKLNRISPRSKEFSAFDEPDIFFALFDCLIVHDYNAGKTFLTGDEKRFEEIEKTLLNSANSANSTSSQNSIISSNLTRESYIAAIEKIQEFIRRGDTYQTNLTQQLRARLPESITPEKIFFNLRKNHPAPFAAFLRRKTDVVISASPERFFKVQNLEQSPIANRKSQIIYASPIKGTRPRGKTPEEDSRLRNELLQSEKDRAENVMIVDLLRNDIGRVCEFGTVEVEKLCDLETHLTLFHLVSTIRGELREDVNFSDILKAAFPCGSITGAPKIHTMRIIDEIETAQRGLSMGAIGYYVPSSKFQVQSKTRFSTWDSGLGTWDTNFDLSVAIRTMVVKNNEALFNVGGGITIDSVPEEEYEESLIKAKALLNAINAKGDF